MVSKNFLITFRSVFSEWSEGHWPTLLFVNHWYKCEFMQINSYPQYLHYLSHISEVLFFPSLKKNCMCIYNLNIQHAKRLQT